MLIFKTHNPPENKLDIFEMSGMFLRGFGELWGSIVGRYLERNVGHVWEVFRWIIKRFLDSFREGFYRLNNYKKTINNL